MESSGLLRGVRLRASLSLRQLAARGHTSHSTLAAYEAGRVAPGTDTMDRLVHAAGFRLEPGVVRGLPDPADRAQELLDVLDLAEHFPARHAATLRCPRFGRATGLGAGGG